MNEILVKEKEVQALHQKIAQDEENLASVQNKNKELIRRIEFMKRMQLTADQDKQKLTAQKTLTLPMGERLGSNVHSALKLQRFHSVESISIIKHEGAVEEHQRDPIHDLLQSDLKSDIPVDGHSVVPSQATGLETSVTQWPGNEEVRGLAEEDQMQVARELVKKNRRIFELEQVGDHRNTSLAGFTGIYIMYRNTGITLHLACTCRKRGFNATYDKKINGTGYCTSS